MKPNEKVWLGDSVYAEFDGYYIKLTTTDGYKDTNTIYMATDVQVNLVKFIERIVEAV